MNVVGELAAANLDRSVLFLDQYCQVNFKEIPRFARNDKAFVVFAVGRGWVGGFAANPAPTNSFFIPNSLSF